MQHNEFPALNILIKNAGIQRDVDFRHGAEALAADDAAFERMNARS